jgi:hypothetical protein
MQPSRSCYKGIYFSLGLLDSRFVSSLRMVKVTFLLSTTLLAANAVGAQSSTQSSTQSRTQSLQWGQCGGIGWTGPTSEYYIYFLVSLQVLTRNSMCKRMGVHKTERL